MKILGIQRISGIEHKIEEMDTSVKENATSSNKERKEGREEGRKGGRKEGREGGREGGRKGGKIILNNQLDLKTFVLLFVLIISLN